MLLNIYSVFDSKAEAYMQPFFFQSDAQAKRAFEDLVNDENTMCGKHPADFTLFLIGQFDDQTAHVDGDVNLNLGNALEFKKEGTKQ